MKIIKLQTHFLQISNQNFGKILQLEIYCFRPIKEHLMPLIGIIVEKYPTAHYRLNRYPTAHYRLNRYPTAHYRLNRYPTAHYRLNRY